MTKRIFEVKNRSVGTVIYSIREDNVRREFAPGETKKISFEELEKLTFQPGGRNLMTNYLQIKEVDATEELGIKRELEYDMSEQDIIRLIKTGSIDAFLDCLDFAPVGVIDLIKHFSTALPMTDTEKIKALKDKTGFDAAAALANIAAEKAEEEAAKKDAPATGRRVQPAATAEAAPARRVQTPDYKVTSTTATTENEQ